MSVEELVRESREHVSMVQSMGHFGIASKLVERLSDKLEELAAENERLRRERVEANNEWRKAYNELSVRSEAALAERDKEIDWQRLCDVINATNRVSARTGKEHITDANKLREFALARNAGGKDGE